MFHFFTLEMLASLLIFRAPHMQRVGELNLIEYWH